ncbi:hypothetical protein O7626_35075 [Micromonospora sp. WMMD1102]|uniref:hypothetical protein n=1 Tax=Micromonospora sp. WMMD1102 TaxID=3016105 RepID=UPI0024155F75|nr:hypothetical protein [Micromonospora sp. WMMD1102]MDG4791071.1 hypothetical protein [Micromonospora sp. WMMD1102]
MLGTAAMRRRGQRPWDEYDPAATLDAVRDDAATIMGSSAGGPTRGGDAGPKSVPTEKPDRTATAGEKTSTAGEKISTGPITDGARKAGGKGGDKSDGLLGTAASRNSGN